MLINGFSGNIFNRKEWIELYAEESREFIAVLEQGETDKLWEISDAGTGIRIKKDSTWYYNYLTSLDYNKIEESVSNVAADIVNKTYSHGISTSTYSYIIKKPLLSLTVKEKIELLKEADSVVKERGSEILFRRIILREKEKKINILNSDGLVTEDIQTQLVFLVQVVVGDPKKGMETGYEPYGGTKGYEIFDHYSPEQIAKTAIDIGERALKSKWVEAGTMPAIISAKAGGTIIHEAVGHGLEGDLVYNGLSVFKDKIGEKVASPLVTIVDDATIPGVRGSFRYDDEGTPSQKTVLIEDGILKNYMTDLEYSKKLLQSTTGNGRRESYRFMPIVRMSNTFMEKGKSTPKEIISSVDKGIFVTKMGGGEVNTITGDFVFEVMEGYEINNGKVGEQVRGAILTGNGPAVIKQIDMVGNDIGFAIGTCGKDGQGVPVTDGMPTTRIREIVVGGRVKS